MDHVAPNVLLAAFEAACLVRSASAAEPPGAFAEFDRERVATRLVSLLEQLGFAAGHQVLPGGGRRRYYLHRVLVPEAQRAASRRTITAGWREGRRALLHLEMLGSSSPRHARRSALAETAWRAAVLSGGHPRGDLSEVRLRDHETAVVLIRAGRILGDTVAVTRRPGYFALSVPRQPAMA